MIRIVLENLLLILAPTLVYVAYVYLTTDPQGKRQKALDETPLLWLFLLGVMLAIGVLAIFGTTGGGKPGEAYQPPVFRDGKIVPGKIKPGTASPDEQKK